MIIGIDGGGTHVRVVVCDGSLRVLGESQGAGVNPSTVGRDLSASRIQEAVRAALSIANVDAGEITAAAAGIAGAATDHFGPWVVSVCRGVLPAARVIHSSDYEIALVGAIGERHGVSVIAGTGSAAFGAHRDGRSMRQGGFGYLLGDEGSGYWLGREALSHVLREMDGRASPSELTPRILGAIGLSQPLEIIPWLYHTEKPRTADVAALAPVVIAASEQGDRVAQGYVARAASELAQMVRYLQLKLSLEEAPVAFIGGLLENDNRLVQVLMRRLHLKERPVARHTPAYGAAILAAQAAGLPGNPASNV